MSKRGASEIALVGPTEPESAEGCPTLIDLAALHLGGHGGSQVARLERRLLRSIETSMFDDGIFPELTFFVVLMCAIRCLSIRCDNAEIEKLLTELLKMLQGKSNDIRTAIESLRGSKKLAKYCLPRQRKATKTVGTIHAAA
jgi:hypothetical protein